MALVPDVLQDNSLVKVELAVALGKKKLYDKRATMAARFPAARWSAR